MQVKEVIKQYGEDKRYIVRDEYEGVYWDREGEGWRLSWRRHNFNYSWYELELGSYFIVVG